jgi:peptidoglycan/xylan/chitin deacetylase (PgdA/CDA1 family)
LTIGTDIIRNCALRSFGIAITIWIVLAPFAACANSFAPIFAYFDVGSDDDPDSNIQIDQFQAHIDLLQGEGFHVASVPDIIDAFERHTPLPDRTVGLTFDEAYRSVADNALPLLKAANMPATIFVTPRLVDRGGEYMTWDDLRRAAHQGFTIGAKIDLDDIADDSSTRTLAAMNDVKARIQQEIGTAPTLFAYADGIATRPLRDMVQSRGFRAAFALQSGPATEEGDRFMLPRFPMTEEFGDIERFRIAANSLPLAITDVLPQDQTVEGSNPPQIGFTVTDPDIDLSKIACFVEDQGKAPIEILGTRVEIRPAQPFDTDDETRVNCTVPGSETDAGRWHWLGFDFYVPPRQ